MERLLIRNEVENDYAVVEEITRNAFWDLHVPGCDEHYLVHIMRKHEDFIPELDFVAELDGRVIGNIMYTKSRLVDESGENKEIITFGPVSILPEYQHKGYGRLLLEYSFDKALELSYDVIVIFGNPANYVGCGFQSSKKYNVGLENGTFPSAMLVKELRAGALEGRNWSYLESSVYTVDGNEAQKFDQLFETREKKFKSSQEIFFILSQSLIQ